MGNTSFCPWVASRQHNIAYECTCMPRLYMCCKPDSLWVFELLRISAVSCLAIYTLGREICCAFMI